MNAVPSRRGLLKAGLASTLLLAFHLPVRAANEPANESEGPQDPTAGEFAPNAFIRIARDGTTTLVMPQVEMGQGVYTSIAMILAEELDADFTRVKLEHAPANDKLYGNPIFGIQATGNSNSIRAFWTPLRKAGASARAMLVAAAAQRWSVAPATCSAANGEVIHAATGRKLAYADLVDAASRVPPPADPPLKDPNNFTLIGRPIKRFDVPAKVNGGTVYGIDAMLPGMVFATIAASPTFGGKVAHVDAATAQAVPGVRKVIAARTDTLAFPFDQRWLMAIWSRFFSPGLGFQPDAARSAEWNRGAYIAEALAHCGECHTPRNLAYALDNRQKFGGALTTGWRAYDISSDPSTGVGGWSDDQLLGYLAAGHAEGHGTAAGPMGEAVDASFSQMAPSDVHALVAYLRTVPAVGSSDLPAALAGPAPSSPRAGMAIADARGRQVFEGACASCHDWTGVSPIIPLATLTGARAVNDPSAVNVAQVVISGARRATPQGVATMPAFGRTYSDTEIAAVANYVTARFGGSPSHIDAAQVAALRKASAQ